MSEREALRMIDDVEYCYNAPKQFFETVRRALEKQIPKKPALIESRELVTEDPFKTQIVGVFTCPCCGEKIMYRQIVKRCLECGQAIDWGVVYTCR